MTRHLLASGLFAGLLAGLCAAALQLAFVVPLLLEGELYETGARVHFSATGSPQSVAGAPSVLAEGLARHLGSAAFNVLIYTGFGLLLVAGFALARRGGVQVDAQRGAVWGLCGFFALQLAPAVGLPPELPGTIAADVAARQMWWIGCVAATLAGLGLIGFARGPAALIAGAALILLPHLIGAPQLDTYWGIAPPELSAHFASRALGVGAASWVILGAAAGWFWSREPA